MLFTKHPLFYPAMLMFGICFGQGDADADQTAGRGVEIFQRQHSLAGDCSQRSRRQRQGLPFSKALAVALCGIEQQEVGGAAEGLAAGGRQIDHRKAAVGAVLQHEVKIGGTSIAGGVPAAVEGVLLIGGQVAVAVAFIVQIELAV